MTTGKFTEHFRQS